MRRLCGVVLVGAAACRFGGPSADPTEYVAATDATAERSEDAASDSTDAEFGAELDAASEATGDEGTPSDDGGTADDSATDSPSPEASSGASCQPTATVCDPVHNTGCDSFHQCDVDSTQTQAPTGLCVLNSSSGGATCLATLFTESCDPGSTCVGDVCRVLCYCDSDCAVGQCCSGASDAGAFLLCESCE